MIGNTAGKRSVNYVFGLGRSILFLAVNLNRESDFPRRSAFVATS